MTDLERVLKIAEWLTSGSTDWFQSKRLGGFCTSELSTYRRKVLGRGVIGRKFSNITVAVNHAVARGYFHHVARKSGPRLFALTAKGRKFAAGL